ncbi:MAG: uracil-DNA glycosylase [Chloroflexi bacterium]|nr:uracil-DNA glycosylase [Chloroflexota bacterium]
MDGAELGAQLERIAHEVRSCERCGLHATRTHAVPGAGSAGAEILFIGEGPGFHEDQQGLPFVGRSGEYLSYLLNLIHLRREDVFITNIIKCRAPNNRDPLPHEIEACRPYFDRQLSLIDPLVVATLGRFSMRLFFPGASISRIHGQARIDGGRAYLPLYHPAAALRNPNLRHDMEADIAQLRTLRDEMRQRRAAGEIATPKHEQKTLL